MAHTQKRKNKDGTYSYRVQIRNNDGHPPQSKTVPTLQEAKDWAIKEEATGRDRVASQEECLRILESCKQSQNHHLFPIVLIAMTTGMRQGESQGLTWDNLDLERGVITLKETKNGRPRSVALVGDVLNLMRERFLLRALHTSFVFPAMKRFGLE